MKVPASQCGAASGFEFSADQATWHAATSVRQSPIDRFSILVSLPAQLRAGLWVDARGGVSQVEAKAKKLSLRYLFADWPTPTVYSNVSYLGPNGELPAPPFEMDVQL